MDMLAKAVVDGVVEELPSSLSAGGSEAVRLVVERVCAGGTLHRIATAHLGFVWLLMPGGISLRPEVGEAAAADPSLVSNDGPVGRVCWEFRSRKDDVDGVSES
ncbi:MAG: hypothetical protein WKF61_00445 [Luteimonas sp.]